MSEHPVPRPGGFTVRRRLPTTAERVYAAFVEPAKLEQWFVVPGYRTPADRMRVDARPGGRFDAVMVADVDGSEIPFGFEYGDLAPPHPPRDHLNFSRLLPVLEYHWNFAL